MTLQHPLRDPSYEQSPLVIALDTNILVRILVEDDERQTKRAVALVRKIQGASETAWVSEIVLCELVWVLSRSYKVKRPQICELLEALLRARHLVFRDAERLRRSLKRYRQGKGDFADYLLQEDAADAGFSKTATFDKALLKESGFFKP